MKKYIFKASQPNFPQLYEAKKARITKGLEGVLDIQHIGSTAVEGLGGKGVIDIGVLAPREKFGSLSEALEKLDYVHSQTGSTPERLFFYTTHPDPDEGERLYHVHLTYPKNPERNNFLRFRDYLRAHPDEARKYEQLKLTAIEISRGEGSRYREIKNPIFNRMLDKYSEASFEQKLTHIYGEKGKEWLKKLPASLEKVKEVWELSEMRPSREMNFHFFAMALRARQEPVVIKMGCNEASLEHEAKTLKTFDGKGRVRLIDFEKSLGAILLEKAEPGNSLSAVYPQEIDEVMDIYAGVIARLKQIPAADPTQFPSIACWLETLNHPSEGAIDKELLDRAVTKCNGLLNSMTKTHLLHADLHLGNVIKHGNDWIAIDPKGLIGETEFEVAAFDIFAPSEIPIATRDMFLKRVSKLAEKTGCDFARLLDWFFVRLILSAVWSVEDKCDPARSE